MIGQFALLFSISLIVGGIINSLLLFSKRPICGLCGQTVQCAVCRCSCSCSCSSVERSGGEQRDAALVERVRVLRRRHLQPHGEQQLRARAVQVHWERQALA